MLKKQLTFVLAALFLTTTALTAQEIDLEENFNETKSLTAKAYYSDLAIFVKYGPDRKVVYQRYIPKKSGDSGGARVLFLQKKGREILIFNDHIKNRTKEITTHLDVEESN